MEVRRDIFQAIADPTRRAIIVLLAAQALTPNALAEHFDTTRQAVSKHLKVLEKAKLIKRGKDAQWRPSVLDAKPLKQANDWIADYRQFCEESFECLDEYLKEIQAGDKSKKGDDNDGKQN